MKKYETYKDSGMKWLGLIPSHWEIKRLKYLATCNDESLGEETPKDLEINYVEIGDVDSVNGINQSTKYLFKDAPSRARRITRFGDVIVSTVRTYLKAIAQIRQEDLIVSTGFAVIRPKLGNSNFVSYSIMNDGFINEVISKSYGISYPAITATELMRLAVPFPPLAEQEAIVAFLDKKTGEIDDLVAQVEREIELLKEYKQSEIARVVTKGLNPNVPMKPSGISWIGDIPAHWNIRKLFQVVTSYYESNKGLKNQNLLSLSYGSIIQKDINKTDGLLPASFETYQIVKPGIIILRLTDLQNDHKSLRVGISKYEGIITSAYEALKVREPNNSDYIYYQLHVNDIHKVFYGMGGGLRQNLNYDGMRYMLIVVPPVSEQEEIVNFITRKSLKIDRLVVELTNQVEYLKEYKQRLIADVVTGKINVQPN
jgi:type I restriction enzyme S subunit